jgi:hypothetical protein
MDEVQFIYKDGSICYQDIQGVVKMQRLGCPDDRSDNLDKC